MNKKIFLILSGFALSLFLLFGFSAYADDATQTTLNPFSIISGYIKARSATNGLQIPSLSSSGNCLKTDSNGKFATTTCGSGSLPTPALTGQTLVASGTSYVVGNLIAGSNITITTSTPGQITFSSTGGSGSPAGSNTDVQFNNSGSFGGSNNLTYTDSAGVQDLFLGPSTGSATIDAEVSSSSDYSDLDGVNNEFTANYELLAQTGNTFLILSDSNKQIDLAPDGDAFFSLAGSLNLASNGGTNIAFLQTKNLTAARTLNFPDATGNLVAASTSSAGLWQSFTNNTLSLGSSTPIGKLTVVGNSGSTTPIFVVASSTNKSSLIITSDGNTEVNNFLGVGETASTQYGLRSTGGSVANIGASTIVALTDVGTPQISSAPISNNTQLQVQGGNAVGGGIIFTVGGSGNTITIPFNGNSVEINTSTLVADLSVQGISGSTTPYFVIASSTGVTQFQVAANGSTTISSLTSGCVNSTSSGALFVATCASGGSGSISTSTTAVIGKVAIWTGLATLGNGSLWDNGTVSGVNATSSTVNFNIQGTGANTAFNVASSSGTSELSVASNGNIGIGTNAPTRTLDIVGTKSTTSTNVLNIQGGTGIAGSVGGQAASIASGNGKQWTSASQTVGSGGNITLSPGGGGDLNDNTITGTQTAGSGGGFNVFASGGGNLDDTPNSAAVTLTAGLGGGFSMQSGSGGDASLGDLTNTTGGAGGGFQLIAQGGGASQSQRIGIGGKGGDMAFSLFSGGSVVALSGATNTTGGNTGSFTVSIGNGGAVTRSGAQNASALSTGGNSGAYTITFGNGGSAAVSGASATSTGGNAGNGSFVGANGGNATGFSGAKSFGGNGTSYSFQTGKGGTGSTANGTDGNTSFIDGYGNTIMTILGNNTQKIGINSTTPNAALVVQGTSTQPTLPVLIISSSTGTSLFQVNANGRVGIATTTPGYGFVNVGTAQFPGLTTASGGETGYACFDASGQLINDSAICITVSAARFKTNIDPLENIINPLAETMAMQAVHYDLKPDAPGYVPGVQYGLIADDIKTIDSNLVVNEVATTTFEGKVYPPGTVEGLAQPNSWVGLFVADIQAQQKEIQDITVKKVKDIQDSWQWIVIGLLALGFVFQQIQINKLKK